MSFVWPVMLAILALVPIFGLLYWLLQQERHLGPHHSRVGLVAVRRPGLRRYVPPAFFLASLALLVVALARPQVVLGQPRKHGTLILAFDVSASMAATDNAPTRLEAAKAVAKTLVLQRPEEIDIGLVVFSNTAVAQLPPTDNPDALLAAIDKLVPDRGTSLGQGILAALQVLAATLPDGTAPTPDTAPGVIVLFTDGENKLNPLPLDAALNAVPLGVRIFPVGFGSLDGTRLTLDGFVIHTELEDTVLRELATLTGGTYFDGGSRPDLSVVYKNLATRTVVEPSHLEVTSWFVGAALAVLLLGAGFSLLWFGRLP